MNRIFEDARCFPYYESTINIPSNMMWETVRSVLPGMRETYYAGVVELWLYGRVDIGSHFFTLLLQNIS